MGMRRVVVVNSITSAKEALVTRGTDFIGREDRKLSKLSSKGGTNQVISPFQGALLTPQKTSEGGLAFPPNLVVSILATPWSVGVLTLCY